ncbi:Uncharacterized conserved protein [Sphingomonas laterariae]|uniref:Uncharacterized conserved protein n=1 Tax=Edaphosphingomonas laterariae TaxID=861865 RepID=A0A239HM08_9SPHN|nr:GFA family protein [Sphingomonas laterariae]SNS82195.1 Uncharacterized conserved protein [Sphingomonas laterariae]
MLHGSCHCGAVAFTVDADVPAEAIGCNCSHCRRKGFLLAFYPPEQFQLLRGEDATESYFFNRHAIEHRFCRTCGTQAFAIGKGPDGSPVRAVNLRCVDEVDPDAIPVRHFDGASL